MSCGIATGASPIAAPAGINVDASGIGSTRHTRAARSNANGGGDARPDAVRQRRRQYVGRDGRRRRVRDFFSRMTLFLIAVPYVRNWPSSSHRCICHRVRDGKRSCPDQCHWLS